MSPQVEAAAVVSIISLGGNSSSCDHRLSDNEELYGAHG